MSNEIINYVYDIGPYSKSKLELNLKKVELRDVINFICDYIFILC